MCAPSTDRALCVEPLESWSLSVPVPPGSISNLLTCRWSIVGPGRRHGGALSACHGALVIAVFTGPPWCGSFPLPVALPSRRAVERVTVGASEESRGTLLALPRMARAAITGSTASSVATPLIAVSSSSPPKCRALWQPERVLSTGSPIVEVRSCPTPRRQLSCL